MKRLKNLVLSLILFSAGIEGLKQSEKISRNADFPFMAGQSRIDLATYDPSLVKIVSPMPVHTLVEVLKMSSDETFKKFKDAHAKAAAGTIVRVGSSYAIRAQNYYNRLLQDWMPMNEAESAAAKYLLSLPSCAIRNTTKMDSTITACQYHGSKILSDIINRLIPIHNLLTSGSLGPVSDQISTAAVDLVHPPELKIQIANIVKLFGDEETTRLLTVTSPSLTNIWQTICKSIQNNMYK